MFSDVHANLHSLESLFLFSENEKIDSFIFLGDAVGYGAYPNECIEMIDRTAGIKLIGNHEAGLLKTLKLSYFNKNAAEALKWTRAVVSPENLGRVERWQISASLKNKSKNMAFAHSKFSFPEEWDYIFNEREALIEFKLTKDLSLDVLFIGHSHIPCCYCYDIDNDSVSFISGDFNIVLKKNFRYIINVGSVGQPRDHDPRSSFVVFDSENMSIVLYRNYYDVSGASSSILKNNLPEFLATRLLKGV